MKWLEKRSWLTVVGGYVLLMLLMLDLFAVAKVSMHQLAIACAVLGFVAIAALTILLRRNRSQSRVDERASSSPRRIEGWETNRKPTRKYIITILVMGVILILGIYGSEGYPLWVTLIGASINAGIICALLVVIRNKIRAENHGDISRAK